MSNLIAKNDNNSRINIWDTLWETSQWVVAEEVLCLNHFCMVPCIYIIYIVLTFSVFSIFNMVFSLVSKLFISCFGYANRMDFYGFTNGACRHTLNLASAAWVLYSLTHDLISRNGLYWSCDQQHH